MVKIKIPLTVYIMWHPNFEEGYSYASKIYNIFSRDIKNPASRGIAIPILFPSEYKDFEHKLEINFDVSERIAVVLLIDENMLIDTEWHSYVEQIYNTCEVNSNFIIYPVALMKTAFNFPVESMKSKNYIRLYDETCKIDYLIFILAHELCRFLYGIERIAEIDITDTPTPPPVKLFLSHAKADGVNLAKSLKLFIDSDTPLDDFFDAQDIAPGYDFAAEIRKAIPNCMLIVIHTDMYSSREWCRKEILMAKEFSLPILIINCLKRNEQRSFPYMANVQTIRINQKYELNYSEIVTTALLEILRHKYQAIYNEFILSLHKLEIVKENILNYPPELLTLVEAINHEDKIVLYPDPPLGSEEIALLKRYNNSLQFITPTLLFSIDIDSRLTKVKLMNGMNIAISISEIQEENKLGLNNLHVQDLMVEIARYLLVEGAKLLYGGDIRYRTDFNFVEILTDLVRNHNQEYEKDNQRIINYVAHYLQKQYSSRIQADLVDVAKFTFIEPLKINFIEPKNDLYDRYVKALDLSKMRRQMNDDLNIRIVLGGKKVGYQGSYPGVLEEVMLAMNTSKKVYLLGAYGGITKEIIKCLLGIGSEVITKEYQSQFNDYGEFYDYYNKMSCDSDYEQIDYESVTEMLNSKGIYGLNNGLSKEENNILFSSSNTMQIISLILKGITS